MLRNRYVRVLVIVVAVLLVPFVMTLLNPSSYLRGGTGGGWDWDPLDFFIMGVLLFVTGLAIDSARQKIANPLYQVLAVIAIIGVSLTIWAELAVDAVSRFFSFVL